MLEPPSSPLTLAHSPCPNDLYLFSAWELGLLGKLAAPSVTITDIQSLNQLALDRRVDICKVSAAVLPALLDDYELLPVGAAVSYGSGPKLAARAKMALAEISCRTIASPGSLTMADYLLRTLLKPARVVYLPFNEIVPALQRGEVPLGVVINESRFLLREHGLYELGDLGALWEQERGLPLPLGALVAKRCLGVERLKEIGETIGASLHYAEGHLEQLMPAITARSWEKDAETIRRHIALYVTSDTFRLSEPARQAFAAMVVRHHELDSLDLNEP